MGAQIAPPFPLNFFLIIGFDISLHPGSKILLIEVVSQQSNPEAIFSDLFHVKTCVLFQSTTTFLYTYCTILRNIILSKEVITSST